MHKQILLADEEPRGEQSAYLALKVAALVSSP